MPQLLVRDLDVGTVERLRLRARRRGRCRHRPICAWVQRFSEKPGLTGSLKLC